MRMRAIMSGKLGEVVRFAIVGAAATLLQYAIYYLLIQFLGTGASKADAHLWSTVAMTVGYVLSFVFNFFASTRFTFKVKANARRGVPFQPCGQLHVADAHAEPLSLAWPVKAGGADTHVLRLRAGKLHSRALLLEEVSLSVNLLLWHTDIVLLWQAKR